MSHDYLDRLARFAAHTRFDDLPAATVSAARLVLLDTLGAVVAGSALGENRRLARLATSRAPGGRASILGHRGRADASWAALVNATAGVALEMDEGNRLGGGHPAIHVIPAALAVAEERGLGGGQLLEAVVAGYELGSRIGGATTPRPNVHSHGTWGTISTAVAVARLGDRDAAGVRRIVNLAASMSPANTWTPALEGATIRNLYPGRSAWEGILAADLDDCGFTGLADGPADVYGTILADRFEPDLAVAGLGERFRIEENYFKLYACCRYNHFALDAIAAIRAATPFPANDILAVNVVTIPFGLRMASANPPTMLAARFSIPWAVAASLVLGHANIDAFDDRALADPRIRDLAQRVNVSADDRMSPRRTDVPTARVSIALRDGTTLEGSAGVVRGDASNPVPPADIDAKFMALASPVLGSAGARRAADAAAEVETLKDVRDLTALFAPA